MGGTRRAVHPDHVVRRLPWRVAALGLVVGLIGACTSLPPVPPTTPAPSPESASTITAEPTETTGPSAGPTVPAAPRTSCGRISAEDCQASIELVRGMDPTRVAAADVIVVDDTCPPDVMCDRLNPFEVLVVLVSDRKMTAGYLVFGRAGPEQVALGWPEPLPAHITAEVATAIGR